MSSDWFTNITQWSSLQLSGRAGHEMGVYAPDSSAVRCSFFLARVRIRPWGCLLPERRLTRQLCKCSAPPRRFIEVLGPGISRHLAVRVLAVSHRGWRIQTTTAKRCPARGAVTISCAYVLMLRRSPEVGASLLLNSLALCQDRSEIPEEVEGLAERSLDAALEAQDFINTVWATARLATCKEAPKATVCRFTAELG
ncbi:unnamed protein product [Effrenium voratum]|nr:unnamed protein product [Effrenium voratum]CAJ1419736.1 unnamed protein product [Effrenium voratum]